MLHEGETFRGIYQIIPAVFIISSETVPLSFDMVTATILDNYNNYETFEEVSDAEEPPEIVEMTPNGMLNVYSMAIMAIHNRSFQQYAIIV